VALGENLLGQALRAYGVASQDVDAATWDRFLRESGPRSREQVLTDIGLGVRLPAIVARRLAELRDRHEPVVGTAAETRPNAILIRGTEGVAVQLAKCCRPIPGDPIIGMIRKGQGLVVHTLDCASLVKQRGERNDWVDVDWEPEVRGNFEIGLRVVADNQRGVLAKIDAAMADEESNIVNISMDDDRGVTTSLYFTLQVANRDHLARIMRRVRRIPEVVRINRTKD
jgi:guanosine-3',5'-bis(diphosphate) 3'-pyrophosphohydrolase